MEAAAAAAAAAAKTCMEMTSEKNNANLRQLCTAWTRKNVP